MTEISVTSGTDASYLSSENHATGMTGLYFSFYERDEYIHLTDDHKDELWEYHKNKITKKGN